jgi:hypothetical protein
MIAAGGGFKSIRVVGSFKLSRRDPNSTVYPMYLLCLILACVLAWRMKWLVQDWRSYESTREVERSHNGHGNGI